MHTFLLSFLCCPYYYTDDVVEYKYRELYSEEMCGIIIIEK